MIDKTHEVERFRPEASARYAALSIGQLTLLIPQRQVRALEPAIDVQQAEGDDAGHLWVVMEGQVGLRFDLPGHDTSKENTVSENTEGNTIGWSSFVPPHKYRLSAYCDSDACKLLQVEKECLVRLFEKDPKVGYTVMSEIANVIGKRFNQLQEEVIKRAGEEIMFNW